MSDNVVSKWERGESLPDAETIVRLADIFGVEAGAITNDGDDARTANTHGTFERTRRRLPQNALTLFCIVAIILASVALFVLSVKAYAVYGKRLAFFYSFVQLWSTLNIVAYIFSIDSVLRYSLTGVLLSCVVFATIAAGFSLKRIVEQDSAAKEFFEDRRDRKAVNL